MQYVTRHDRIVAISPKAHRNVVRRVAGSWRKRIVVAHQFGLPSFHDWKHAIAEVRQRRLSVLLRPIVEFAFRNQIARLGESRRPPPVLQPRVPADMIDMQMRAHDEIDIPR